MSLFQKLMTTDIPTTQSGYPLTINKSSGARNLIDYSVTGNSSQTGTPTPEAPIEVTSVGDKTKNLFDKEDSSILNSFMIHSSYITVHKDNKGFSLKLIDGETYTVSKQNTGRFYICASANPIVSGTNDHLPLLVQKSGASVATFTVPVGKPYIDIVYWHGQNDAGYTESEVRNTLTLVEGSTAPTSYIPYGYELPVIVGGNCGVVDLGTLNWVLRTDMGQNIFASSGLSKVSGTANVFMSNTNYTLNPNGYLSLTDKQYCGFSTNYIMIKDSGSTIAQDFKNAMSGKYLYYQRTTDDTWTIPTKTNIYLNNPLRKISTYADYIDYKNQQVIRNIGVTTLSAGTHTLADAVSNGTYLCTQQESGTLSGQDITLNTGVTNAIVYYPLATPTTESITIPALTVSSGTNTITTGTELAPSNLSSKTWTWRF